MNLSIYLQVLFDRLLVPFVYNRNTATQPHVRNEQSWREEI